MTTCGTTLLLFLATATTVSCLKEMEVLKMAQNQVMQARNWVFNASVEMHTSSLNQPLLMGEYSMALNDCVKLYEESESRLAHLITHEASNYTDDDALVWISAVATNHRTCLEGLKDKRHLQDHAGQNLTALLYDALGLYGKTKGKKAPEQGGIGPPRARGPNPYGGLLVSWSPSSFKANFIVAQDGSGTHRSIREAVGALASLGPRRPQRAIIYVKAGIYTEKVEIGDNLKNVMFVGDGIDRTIVTGRRNVIDGSTTLSSATFDVSGDGFWARDMTFENTAGPEKHQAVALKVSSDLSVFYRCSFKGYQDTLYVFSNRQFFRDCHIHGTVDYIFGNSAAVFQNCDIFVRKPMSHQSNLITAHGRDHPQEPTGIVVQNCRVRPSSEFASVKSSYSSYLGRPWKKYSRTLFLKTDLDGLINPSGWKEWSGSFALSTLFYAEYMNAGNGASVANRVKWPGFHVLHSAAEASPFTARRFVQGESWIPATGVPFSAGI